MNRLTWQDLWGWYPGAWIARKSPWLVGRVFFPFLVVVVPLSSPFLLDMIRNGGLSPVWKWTVLVLIGGAAAFIAYLKESESRLEKLEKEDAVHAVAQAKEDVWRQIGELNTDAAGAVGQLVAVLNERKENPGKLPTELEHLQTALLANIADSLSKHLGINRKAISANWCVLQVEDGKEYFTPLRYDRNDVKRPHGNRRHELGADRPGASRALLSGAVTLVPDTQSSDMAAFFPEKPPYRSILSIPITVRNLRIGVVNIDAKEANRLSLEHEPLVADLAYLIGLCEHLKQG